MRGSVIIIEPPAGAADTSLRELYTAEWVWRVRELGDQSFSGLDEPPAERLPDCSPQGQQARLDRWLQARDALAAIDEQGLSAAARIDYRVYAQQLGTLITQQRFATFERPANSDTSFWGELIQGTRRVLATAEDGERYLAQLHSVSRYIDQNIENMRAGVNRGVGPARISMMGRDAPIRGVAHAASPRSAPFARPFATLPHSVPAATRELLQDRADAVVADSVLPAFRRLLTFYLKDYLPVLPERIDVSSQPDGEAFYQAQLDEFTTTGLTGEQIHHIGLEAVSSIHDEMRTLAVSAGFHDEVAMLSFMRSDSQFVETSAIGLLRRAAWHAKQFDEVAHLYFGRLPRMRFGIVEPDPDIAPYYTAGRGGPHSYILNTFNLPARKLYSLPALTLHEAAPGHAFQIPFALEMPHPDFRRKSYISAYGEGWALYTERLGVEMGMYQTPFEMMGMLSYQMWRAARLVIDPGIHLLGWSRDKAQAYLSEHTALSDHEVTTEVDRYIAWPGQATSYYVGMRKVQQLRLDTERALAERFSLRAFHDMVLSLGSVPLDVLADEVSDFIAAGGISPFTQDREQ